LFASRIINQKFIKKIWLSIIGCFVLAGFAYRFIQNQNFGFRRTTQTSNILIAHSLVFFRGKSRRKTLNSKIFFQKNFFTLIIHSLLEYLLLQFGFVHYF